MNKKLHAVFTLLWLATAGCSYTYNKNTLPPALGPARSQYTLINNTGYVLDVYQDGKYLGKAEVGRVLPVYGTLLWRRTVVSVTGRDDAGHYVGTRSWVYEYGVPEAWTVSTLDKPQE